MFGRLVAARPVRGLAALVLVAAAAGFFLLNSAFFQVRAVRVTGNVQLDAAHIAALTGVRIGDNLWDASPNAIADRLRQDPWIASAKVARRFPGTWEVQVSERRVAAAVPYHRRFLALDAQGVALGVVDELARLDVPLITGAAGRDIVLGRVYPAPEVSAALAAIGAMRPETVKAVSEVHLDGAAQMTVYLEGGLRVEVGQASDVRARVSDLEAILADLRRRGLTARYIDLRFSGQPVVRLRD